MWNALLIHLNRFYVIKFSQKIAYLATIYMIVEVLTLRKITGLILMHINNLKKNEVICLDKSELDVSNTSLSPSGYFEG